MTTGRIRELAFTQPVLDLHYAFVIKDHRLDEFETEELVAEMPVVRVAHVGDYPIVEHLEKEFPNARFTQLQSDQEFFDNKSDDYDVLLTSLEAGKSWSLLRPEYTTVFRREGIESFPASYAVAQSNVGLVNFLNSWLELKRASGKIDDLFDYWIQGKNAIPAKPRWSVIKDVLHWKTE